MTCMSRRALSSRFCVKNTSKRRDTVGERTFFSGLFCFVSAHKRTTRCKKPPGGALRAPPGLFLQRVLRLWAETKNKKKVLPFFKDARVFCFRALFLRFSGCFCSKTAPKRRPKGTQCLYNRVFNVVFGCTLRWKKRAKNAEQKYRKNMIEPNGQRTRPQHSQKP